MQKLGFIVEDRSFNQSSGLNVDDGRTNDAGRGGSVG